MRQKIIAYLRYINLEAVTWIAGLLLLAISNPVSGHHFSICPIKNLGFSFCPGCGMGESISHLFGFEIIDSLNSHPLGVFALPILVYRVIYLLRKSYNNYRDDFSQTIGVTNNG
jgi:hypothetical protein